MGNLKMENKFGLPMSPLTFSDSLVALPVAPKIEPPLLRTPEEVQVMFTDNFGQDWVVGQDQPLPQDLEVNILKSNTPEKSVLRMAKGSAASFPDVPHTAPLTPIPAERFSIIPDPSNAPKTALLPLLDQVKSVCLNLNHLREDYQLGDAVSVGPVTAVELKAPPMDGQNIVYDPVLIKITGKSFKNMNDMFLAAALAQLRAETIRSIITVIPKPQILEILKADGYKGSVEDWLVSEALGTDTKRLTMMKTALSAQLVAGRLAIVRAINEHFPSGSIVFLAKAIDAFHRGGIVNSLKKRPEEGFVNLGGELARICSLLNNPKEARFARR